MENSRPATWARLITPYNQWNRHSYEDTEFCEFLIRSGITVQPKGLSVDPGNLEKLCQHFLVFATDISYITDQAHLDNLREYAYRGGFLYVEVCHDQKVTPSMKTYHNRQMAVFERLFPTSMTKTLSPKHSIFNTPFPVPEGESKVLADPTNSQMFGAAAAFYGLFDDDRMIALLGQQGVRCAWGWDANRTIKKMRLSANALAIAYSQAGHVLNKL